MNNISRLAVLVAAPASLFAALSSTAGATTFTNSGATSFHGTGTGGTLTITAATANDLACTGSDATGNVPSGVFTTVTGNVNFAPCTLIHLHTKNTCTYTFTPESFSSGVSSGSAALNCTASLATSPGTALCNITGSTAATYTNPWFFSSSGKLTLLASNTLLISNANDASCSSVGVPTGQTRNTHLSQQTITATNAANSPVFASP